MARQTFTAGQVLTAAQMTTLQTNDYNQTVSTKTASYTLVAADAGTKIVMNAGATNTTITVNTSLFSAGDTLTILNISTSGTCTITAGTATVATAGSLALGLNAGGTLYFTSAGVSVFQANGGATSAPTSRIRLHTHNGFGSSSTKIPRFTTTVVNSGSDITYADSASLGSTFTINTAGMYGVSFGAYSAASAPIVSGLSLNSTQLSTNIWSITAADRLAQQHISTTDANGSMALVSIVFYFAVNDVIRPHNEGNIPVSGAFNFFNIARVN